MPPRRGPRARPGAGTRLLSSFWAMDRHVPSRILPTHAADSVEALLRETSKQLERSELNYLVVGRLSLRGSTFADLGRAPLPRHLRPVQADADVRVYRVAPPPLAEIAAPLRAIERRADQFEIEVDLPAGVPEGMQCFARLHGPQGEEFHLVLQSAEGRPGFALPFNLSRAPGTWRLTVVVRHPDGTFYAADPLELASGDG